MSTQPGDPPPIEQISDAPSVCTACFNRDLAVRQIVSPDVAMCEVDNYVKCPRGFGWHRKADR